MSHPVSPQPATHVSRGRKFVAILVAMSTLFMGMNTAVAKHVHPAQDSAVAKIEGYNRINYAYDLTIAELNTAIGGSQAITRYLDLYKNAIANSSIGALDTVGEIQNLVASIHDNFPGQSSDFIYFNLGTTNFNVTITADMFVNCFPYTVATPPVQQKLLSTYIKALEFLVYYQGAPSATACVGAVTEANRFFALIDNIPSNYLELLNQSERTDINNTLPAFLNNVKLGNIYVSGGYIATLAAAASGDKDTLEDVQVIIDETNLRLRNENGVASEIKEAIAANTPELVIVNLLNQCFVGSTPALDNLLPIYRKILTFQFNQGILENFGSSECSQVVTSVNDLYALIDNIPDNYRAVFGRNPGLEQTYVEFLYILFDGVEVDYFTYDGGYIDTLKSTPLEGKNTVEEVQALIFATNTRIGAIVRTEVLNSYDNNLGYGYGDLEATGVARLIQDNLDEYKTAIIASSLGGVDTLAEIQSMVDTVNRDVEIAKIEAYTPQTVSGLTIAQLVAAGVTVPTAIEANLAGYKMSIGDQQVGDANSTSKIQALVIAVNSTLYEIEYTASYVTKTLNSDALFALGVTSVEANNILAYKTALLAAANGDADTVVKVQKIVTDSNARVAAIDAFTTQTVTFLTVPALMAVGASPGATIGNLNGYKYAIAGNDASTASLIVTLVSIINMKVAMIDTYTLENVDQLTVAQLEEVGITFTTSDNLAGYKTAIAGADASTVDKIQALVTSVDTAARLASNLAAIEAYVSGDSLTEALLVAVGVTGAITDNVGAYRSAIAAAAVGAADTRAEIQAIVTLVNAATLVTTTAADKALQDAKDKADKDADDAKKAADKAADDAKKALDKAAADAQQLVSQAQAAAQAAQASAAAASSAAQAQAAAATKAAADAKAAADVKAAADKAAADKAVADAKAAADKAVADAKAAADAKALADKAAADKAAADAKALADAKAAADAKTASDLKKALANTVKASARSAGGTFVSLDLADSYSGLKAEVLVRKPGSKTFTVLGSVALGERGYGKLSTKTAVDQGSLIRVVIGGKIVKSLTF